MGFEGRGYQHCFQPLTRRAPWPQRRGSRSCALARSVLRRLVCCTLEALKGSTTDVSPAQAQKEGETVVYEQMKAALTAALEVKQATLRPEIQLLNKLLAADGALAWKQVGLQRGGVHEGSPAERGLAVSF